MGAYSEEQIKKVCHNVLENLANVIDTSEWQDMSVNVAAAVTLALNADKEAALKEELVNVSRSLYCQGFFAGTSGNISVRLSSERLMVTPSSVSKLKLAPQQIVVTDPDGNYISGDGSPSSEIKMHLAIYKKRQDVNAVVHAHPPFTTGFAAAGLPLDQPVLPEAILVLGRIPIVEYGTPSTWELPEALDPYIKDHNAFLLANHGALTIGSDLVQAAHRIETMELFAKVILIARMLGGEKLLTEEQLKKLANIK